MRADIGRPTQWCIVALDGAHVLTSTVISNSQIQCYKRCRRKYYLGYVRKLKTRRYAKTGARQLGTRVHGALQAYYDREGKRGRVAALEYLEQLRLQEIADATTDNGDVDLTVADAVNKEHALAVVMLEGYCDWIEETGGDEDLQVVETEAALRAPSPVPGVELIGKLDVLLKKISTGELGFMDHKTGDNFAAQLRMLSFDEQFRMYALMIMLLAAKYGTSNTARFQIRNMLKKSKRTVRAKPPFYDRYEVYISDAELRDFWNRLYGEIMDILEMERRLEAEPDAHRRIAYPTPRNECSWDCDFVDVCPLFDDPNADPEYILAENFVVGDPHEHYEGKLTVVDERHLVQSAQGTDGEQ